MVSMITAVLAAIPLYVIGSTILGLRRNITAAKRSGLPYIITPLYLYSPIWLAGHRIWIPLIKRLPRPLWENWIPYMEPDWPWKLLFDPFKEMGDVFISVSASGNIVWVANAEATHQITSRREAFPKPLESYKFLDLFGRNVVTTEGAEWKLHRKISCPSFNEKNNALVFAESVRQAQGMLRKWMGPDYKGNVTVEEVPLDTMRVTLHIISRVGFGVQLLWPGEQADGNQTSKDASYSSHIPPPGHTMSFEESLKILLEKLILVLIIPRILLKYLPFDATKKAYESFTNWDKYMKELFEQKVQKASTADKTEGGMDIMGALARSSYGDSSHGSLKKGPANRQRLSDSDILGNAFVILLAGHETTANSVHFSLVELAIRPRFQRLMQKDVLSIYGDTSPQTWDYDSSINSLLGCMLGAVLNEELRLIPPVLGILKRVPRNQDQVIEIDGRMVTLPRNAMVTLVTTAVQRNPRYWSSKPSKVTDKQDDINDFNPERWLEKGNSDMNTENSNVSTDLDDFGGFTGHSSSARLFHPVRGSYIPFSDGARSCLGRRLAQVEVMAIFAVIFQKYSVELAVDEWATDEEVAKMSVEQKKEVYKKAQLKARETLKSASTVITLKLQEGFIPMRYQHITNRVVLASTIIVQYQANYTHHDRILCATLNPFITMSGVSTWLQKQRKSDLVELADSVGLTDYDGMKKQELEAALDSYLTKNSAQFSSDTRLTPFYKRRADTSPIKKEPSSTASEIVETKIRPAKRRVTKVAEEIANTIQNATDDSEAELAARSRNAITRTPRAALSFASSVPLPPSPSEVAEAIDRQTQVMRSRVSRAYKEMGLAETAETTRETLSSIVAVQGLIIAFELYNLRKEILADRYVFTIPTIPFLKTSPYPVLVPDLFLLLTSSFWGPATLWGFTSFFIPLAASYFFNLTSKPKPKSSHSTHFNYEFDPFTFNIVKALLTFVVYGQGATFNGLVNSGDVDRINSAIYGGWQGVIVGSAIGVLTTIYEAIAKK
ncbi:hypothetical protein B7463_g11045, partial [Scytalidium lignicola]